MANRSFFEKAEHGGDAVVDSVAEKLEDAGDLIEHELEEVGSAFQRFFAEPRQTAALAKPLALAGAAALVASGVMSWTTVYRPEMGDLDFWWTASGTRTFTLIAGVVVAALALVRWQGKRAGGLVVSAAMMALGAGYLVQLINVTGKGGELDDGTPLATGAPSIGVFLALAGGVLALLGFRSMHDGAEWMFTATTRRTNQRIGVVVATVLGLGVVIFGLRIEESNRFLAYLAVVGSVSIALGRLGVLTWISESSRANLPLTSVCAGLAAAAFPFTQQGDGYWIRVFASVVLFACVAIGLNIVVGLAGLLDLGYVAFFGVGAYAGGILGGAALSYYQLELPFPIVILIGACAAALFGVIVGAPTLRLEGDYLAIVTLAFGEIFREVAINNIGKLTGGSNGVAQIPNLSFFGKDFGTDTSLFGINMNYFANYYFLELVLLAFVVLVFVRLNNSRIGRAWVAIREDETAAQAMGVNTIAMKLLAFALGAFLAGSAGTINAHLATQVSPDSYDFFQSILLLAACVLGGLGSVNGAMLGAAALLVIPEKLRFFKDYRLMLFGLALILMMRFRPEGIIANTRNRKGSTVGGARSPLAPGGSGGPAAPAGATTSSGSVS